MMGAVSTLVSAGQLANRWKLFISQAYWRARLGALGKGCRIYDGVYVVGGKNVFIGDKTVIWHRAFINAPRGKVIIGNNCSIGVMAYINAPEGTVRLGNNVLLGPMAHLHSAAHRLDTAEGHRVADVVVEDNAAISSGVIVTVGVHIGENSIVGSGSFVMEDIPPNSIAYGYPARVARQRKYIPEDKAR